MKERFPQDRIGCKEDQREVISRMSLLDNDGFQPFILRYEIREELSVNGIVRLLLQRVILMVDESIHYLIVARAIQFCSQMTRFPCNQYLMGDVLETSRR
jgi:hypothetical protein